MNISKCIGYMAIAMLAFGFGASNVSAQTSQSVLYVPLIGITSVPEPLALSKGAGRVTYHYSVKNFLREIPLTDIKVTDDKCDAVKYVEGDDNRDAKLDYGETWRYECVTTIATTTESVATATGMANNITATHKAYATVVVGSNNVPPLVSIVNITKVAYPLSLPVGGGQITFTYRVNNPGLVPLSDVRVVDDKCIAMSSKLGDTNGNNLLDTNEVWMYSCTTNLTQTTTNTATVTAVANGLIARGVATLTVDVSAQPSETLPNLPFDKSVPSFPDTGENPNIKIIIWGTLAGVLIALLALFVIKKVKSK